MALSTPLLYRFIRLGNLAWFTSDNQFGDDPHYFRAERVRVLQILLGYGYLLYHGSKFLGWGNMLSFVLVAIFVSTVHEIIGSKYGLIFGGEYHYKPDSTPGPMIFGIPILIPLVWSGLIYMGLNYSSLITGLIVSQQTFNTGFSLIIFTGILLMILDMILDPIAVDEDRWKWSKPGSYYGVPSLNFLGWFGTVVIILSIFFNLVVPVKNAKEVSFLIQHSPSVLFAILPAIAARPCYERGLKIPGHIGLLFSFILTVTMVLKYKSL